MKHKYIMSIPFNIAILGTISSGKSTLLNAIFGKMYSDMKIRRTTMIPSQYRFTRKVADTMNVSSIQEINQRLNDKYSGDTLWNGVDVPSFVVSMPKHFIKPYRFLDISIYDIPGLNDQKTKDAYYEWVRNNTNNFDLVYLLFDINSGLNTSDELEILQLVCGMMKHNMRLKVIVLGNKCDSLLMKDDNTYEMDEEHRDIFEKQMIPTIESQMRQQSIHDDRYRVIPFCSRINYIYRTLCTLTKKEKDDIVKILRTAETFEELDTLGYINFKHLEEIIVNDIGRMKWNRMSKEQKLKRLEKLLVIDNDYADSDDNNTDEIIQMSGGKLLFQLTKYYTSKMEIIPNILYRMFDRTDTYENIKSLVEIKNLQVSTKVSISVEYQRMLLMRALKYIPIDSELFIPSNIHCWSSIIIALHTILTDVFMIDENELNGECFPILHTAECALKQYTDEYVRMISKDYKKTIFDKITSDIDPYSNLILILTKKQTTDVIYEIQKQYVSGFVTYIKSLIGLHTNPPRITECELSPYINTFNRCLDFSIKNHIHTSDFMDIYDAIIDSAGRIYGFLYLEYGIEDEFLYIHETLRIVLEDDCENIEVLSRYRCVDRILKMIQSRTFSIQWMKNILNDVYKRDQNNYYKLIQLCFRNNK